MENHDGYWKKVWNTARMRLERIFGEGRRSLDYVVGDDGFIDSFADAKKVLAYAMRHADDCEEKACAILSVCEALHALHELSEHSSAMAGADAD